MQMSAATLAHPLAPRVLVTVRRRLLKRGHTRHKYSLVYRKQNHKFGIIITLVHIQCPPRPHGPKSLLVHPGTAGWRAATRSHPRVPTSPRWRWHSPTSPCFHPRAPSSAPHFASAVAMPESLPCCLCSLLTITFTPSASLLFLCPSRPCPASPAGPGQSSPSPSPRSPFHPQRCQSPSTFCSHRRAPATPPLSSCHPQSPPRGQLPPLHHPPCPTASPQPPRPQHPRGAGSHVPSSTGSPQPLQGQAHLNASGKIPPLPAGFSWDCPEDEAKTKAPCSCAPVSLCAHPCWQIHRPRGRREVPSTWRCPRGERGDSAEMNHFPGVLEQGCSQPQNRGLPPPRDAQSTGNSQGFCRLRRAPS